MFLSTFKASMLTWVKGLTAQRLVTTLLALGFGVSATIFVGHVTSPEPWSPLGPYPVQYVAHQQDDMVVSSVEGSGNSMIPKIHLSSGSVKIIGSKCAKEDVQVKGHYGWVSIVPGGFSYNVPSGPPGHRLAGCQQFDFKNEIPEKVAEWAKEAEADGIQPEVVITGCEVPIKGDGTQGVEICWRTEPFALVG